jgi:O-antigen/teichoic acid export membrane protein
MTPALPPASAERLLSRNTLLLFASQAAVRILSFVPALVLASHLGVFGFGLYSFALAFTFLFAPLCDLGIDTAIVREMAAHPESRGDTARTALGLKLLFSSVTVALLAAASLLEPVHRGHPDVLRLAGLLTVLRAAPATVSAQFRAEQRMGLDAMTAVLQRLLEVLALAGAAAAGLDLERLLLLLAAANAAGLALTAAIAAPRGFRVLPGFSGPVASRLLGQGLPFALSGLAVTFSIQGGTVILGHLSGEAAVGVFRPAFSLVSAIGGMSAPVCLALYPAIAAHYERDHALAVRLSARSLCTALALGVPGALLCSLLAGPVIDLLYPGPFAASAGVLRILAWWIPPLFVSNVLSHVLAAIGCRKTVLLACLANAAANAGLSVSLVPALGPEGVAAALVSAEFFGLVLVAAAVLRRFGNPFDLRRIAGIAAAALAIGPVALLRDFIPVVPLALAAAGAYGAALLAFGAVRLADLRPAPPGRQP